MSKASYTSFDIRFFFYIYLFVRSSLKSKIRNLKKSHDLTVKHAPDTLPKSTFLSVRDGADPDVMETNREGFHVFTFRI